MTTQMLEIEKPKIDRHRQLLLSFGRCLTYFPEFIQRFYELLKDSHPDIRQKFENTDDAKQVIALRRVFNIIIMFDQGEDMAKQVLDRIHKSHGKSGLNITPEMYNYWTKSLLQAISEADPNFNQELQDQWQRVVNKAVKYVSTGEEDYNESAKIVQLHTQTNKVKLQNTKPEVLETLQSHMPDFSSTPTSQRRKQEVSIANNIHPENSQNSDYPSLDNETFIDETHPLSGNSSDDLHMDTSLNAALQSFDNSTEPDLHTFDNLSFESDFHTLHDETKYAEESVYDESQYVEQELSESSFHELSANDQLPNDKQNINFSHSDPVDPTYDTVPDTSIPQLLDDEFDSLSFDEEGFSVDGNEVQHEVLVNENSELSEFDRLEFTEFPGKK